MNRAWFCLLIGGVAAAGQAPAVEEEARAAVQKLGGQLVRDPALPGNPIVAVNL